MTSRADPWLPSLFDEVDAGGEQYETPPRAAMTSLGDLHATQRLGRRDAARELLVQCEEKRARVGVTDRCERADDFARAGRNERAGETERAPVGIARPAQRVARGEHDDWRHRIHRGDRAPRDRVA